MNVDWSHLGYYLEEPTTVRDDKSGERGYARISGLGCVDTRAGKRTGLVGQESVGRPVELRSSHMSRATIKPRALNVSPLFQPESVKEGHLDKISETTVCWSFRVLLTSLASKLQSP